MSDKDFDPLASLFSTAQLSGLSRSNAKEKTQKGLDINLTELEGSSKRMHRPKTPPKPKDDIPEEDLLEIEEISSEEELENPPNLEEAPEAQEPIILDKEPEIDTESELEKALAEQESVED